jgi:thiol-disulfide isomerase/thioredoxin
MSRLSSRAGAVEGKGDGFWSGAGVGASLGFLYAPCAGPILAGVITVSASQSFSAGRLAVAVAYGIGSALVLYLLMLGGRKVVAPLARRGIGLQIAMGAVMVLVALAMLKNYDVRFQGTIASDLPSFLVDPSKSLEETATAKSALAAVRGSNHGIGSKATGAAPETNANDAHRLPVLGKAPEFIDNQVWSNTPGGRGLTLKSLRGRVVLVDFWHYTCINCIRTLPYLKAWDQRYRKDGLTIVGIHTPEFPFEKDGGNVQEAIESEAIHYPVAQDNELATWSAYGTESWPTQFFVDAHGNVRYVHSGEGEYGEQEQVIRSLLAEAGKTVGGGVKVHALVASQGVTTPETFIGAARAERFANARISLGSHDFSAPPTIPANEFAYRGRWKISLDSATAGAGASVDLNFGARRVYLVLDSPGHSRRMRVLLDGHPISNADAGSDVHGSILTVTSPRLYSVVELPKVGNHLLTLEAETGLKVYVFKFG